MSMSVVLKAAKQLWDEDDEVRIQIGDNVWTLAEEDGGLTIFLRSEDRMMANHPRVNVFRRGSLDARRIREKQRVEG